MTQSRRGNRRGANFTVRITEEERAGLEAKQRELGGPKGLGPWLVWRGLDGEPPRGTAFSSKTRLSAAERFARVILDLCGGSGSWSRPYYEAGYDVRVIDIAEWPGRQAVDVRVFRPPSEVWGVLAAPPCTMFSCARNGCPELARDFVEGMACVNACMRIILQCRPKWWALENPSGMLTQYLGTPRDTFEPFHFGDAWTKRTCLWGDFALPARGPFVEPEGSAMDRSGSAARAVTPPGFARAFFEANP